MDLGVLFRVDQLTRYCLFIHLGFITMQAYKFPALWANYINTGKFKLLIDLYADNATLIPTFSPEYINDKIKLTSYFEKLALKKNLCIDLEKNSIASEKIDGNTYIITGEYSFTFESDGQPSTFPARYTFIINLTLNNPILHHHSSQEPVPFAS